MRFYAPTKRCSNSIIPALTAVFFALLAGIGWSVPVHAAAALPINGATSPASRKPDAETLLVGIYTALSENRLRQAMRTADQLVQAYPNFQLGHLIRGDLLLMHTSQIKTLGAVQNAPTDRLNELRAEAAARLKSIRERPAPDLVPRSLLRLRGDQRHVFLIDAKRSRLFVYENRHGEPKLVNDYYVTQGKLGIYKLREGDQKTPVGVYYVTSRVPGPKLPDFFGTGALSINYPNEWDKLNGRGGSGIWLHGTSSDTFSRPPLASDGCVVLANPDLDQLYASVDVGKTPVVIAEQAEFITKARWAEERTAAMQLLESWRQDIEGGGTRFDAHYSDHLRSAANDDRVTWLKKYLRLQPSHGPVSLALKDISQFLYPGRENLIVATFTLAITAGKQSTEQRRRQYWAKDGLHWKIIYESHV